MFNTLARFRRRLMEMMKDQEELQEVVMARKKPKVRRPRRGQLKVTLKQMEVKRIRRVMLS